MRTYSEVMWPQTLEKSCYPFSFRYFNKTVNESIVEESLTTSIGSLIIEACTYNIKWCHKGNHSNTAYHASRCWNKPAAWIEETHLGNL